MHAIYKRAFFLFFILQRNVCNCKKKEIYVAKIYGFFFFFALNTNNPNDKRMKNSIAITM